MKKKVRVVITLLLVVMMAFTISACNSGNGGSDDVGSVAAPAGSSVAAPADTGSSSVAAEPMSEPVTLTVTHGNMAGSLVANLYDYLGEQINARSNGSITMEIHPGGTLVSQDQLFDSISTGNVDMGDLVLSYYIPYIEDLNILAIPGIYRSDDIPAILEVLSDPVDRCLQQHGLKLVVGWGTMPENWLLGSQANVTDPAKDFGTKTVRVSGAANGTAIEKWGGSPVNIPIGDLPTALERKTVDMAMTSYPVVGGMKLYEPAPYVTSTLIPEAYCGIVMNLDKWNSLSDEQRAVFEDFKQEYIDYCLEEGYKGKNELIEQMKSEGVTYAEATEEHYAYYHEKAMEIVSEQFTDPNEMVQEFLDCIEQLQ